MDIYPIEKAKERSKAWSDGQEKIQAIEIVNRNIKTAALTGQHSAQVEMAGFTAGAIYHVYDLLDAEGYMVVRTGITLTIGW